MTAGYGWRHADIVGWADELAARINFVGGPRRNVVALECDRGLPSVIALTATLRAGYVPLLGSQSDPAERRARLRDLSGAGVVVRGGAGGEFSVSPASATPVAADLEAVYLAATSGTTGQPKVAPIGGAVFRSYVRDIRRVFGLSPRDRVLQFAHPGFDVFVEEVVPTFHADATLVVPPWYHAPSAEVFLDFLDANKVSVVNLPSSYWTGVVDHLRRSNLFLPASVRLVVIGSEPVARTAVEWAREALPDVKLLNAYGTSELAPTCFVFDCDELAKATAHPDAVPIGRPLPFMRYEISPGPEGGHGTLHLAPSSATGPPGLPGFDTGDLATLGFDGYVYVHGRADLTRLKRGGVTVNAESLAAAARECVGVLGAVVRVDQESASISLIVQSTDPNDEVAERVAAHLATVFPSAWQPDRIRVMSEIERAAGTKLSTLGRDLVGASLTPVVREAWTRWTEALDLNERTDFFDAGGDSIGAVRMCSQLSAALSEKVPVQLIFANPRFGDFVQAVDALLATRTPVSSCSHRDRLEASAHVRSEHLRASCQGPL